jgi:serine/threonine-protein kinase
MHVLGAGGMGAVVAAEHVGLGDQVAVKFLNPKMLGDVAFVERFIREARVTARIKNEHVVRVFDVGSTDGGLPFIAMELLDGEDLGHVSARGPLPIPLAVDCVLQAMVGLLHAHSAGVTHRDIKPSNLWLTRRSDGAPFVKVLDFGISKLVETGSEDARLTDTRSVFGSPSYMSPEQVRSAKRVDPRADVWALGVVLFELLTQKLPFEADSVHGILAAIVADAPIPLRALRPDAPAELEVAVLGLLEKNPDARATLVDTAVKLRPFASPVGQATADLIARSYPNGAPLVHAPLISAPPPPLVNTVAMGDTMPNVSTTYGVTTRSGRGPLIGVLSTVALAGVVVGALFFSGRLPVGQVTSSTGSSTPSAVVPATSLIPEPPAPPPAAAVAEPVTSAAAAVPSASPSAALATSKAFPNRDARLAATPKQRPGAGGAPSASPPPAANAANAPNAPPAPTQPSAAPSTISPTTDERQ